MNASTTEHCRHCRTALPPYDPGHWKLCLDCFSQHAEREHQRGRHDKLSATRRLWMSDYCDQCNAVIAELEEVAS